MASSLWVYFLRLALPFTGAISSQEPSTFQLFRLHSPPTIRSGLAFQTARRWISLRCTRCPQTLYFARIGWPPHSRQFRGFYLHMICLNRRPHARHNAHRRFVLAHFLRNHGFYIYRAFSFNTARFTIRLQRVMHDSPVDFLNNPVVNEW